MEKYEPKCFLLVKTGDVQVLSDTLVEVFATNGTQPVTSLDAFREIGSQPWEDHLIVSRCEPKGFCKIFTRAHEFVDIDKNELATALSKTLPVVCICEAYNRSSFVYSGIALYENGEISKSFVVGDAPIEGEDLEVFGFLNNEVAAESDVNALANDMKAIDLQTVVALLGFEFGGWWDLLESDPMIFDDNEFGVFKSYAVLGFSAM